MSAKRLFGEVEMKQEPVAVSDTQKVDLSIMAFYIRDFAAQMFSRLAQ